MNRKRVAVAMSGGVDSSVAAAVLMEEGYDVVGVTLRLSAEAQGCEQDARGVASKLGIPHHVLDVRREFERCVVANFVEQYCVGRTPNPCVRCNEAIKFGALLRFAEDELGARWLATGHYARAQWDSGSGRWKLLRGVDRSKDQAYVLYRLNQTQLGKALFPLGGQTKVETRERAAALGLTPEERPESQDICFIPGGRYRDFLKRRVPELVRPGPIVDTSGRVLGEHQGIAFHTVGQRRGLRIATGGRLYVVAIDAERNAVVVGGAAELSRRSVVVIDISLISGERLTNSVVVSAKIRYNTQDSPAVLRPLTDDSAELVFDEEQRAVTPGQSAVFYSGETVLGGGVIDSRLSAA